MVYYASFADSRVKNGKSIEEQSYVLISLQQDHNFVRISIQPRENCFSSFSMITNVVLSLGLIEFACSNTF